MNNIDIKNMIENNKLGNFDFGDSKGSPGEEWIEKAEIALGQKLPPSYKFFLENFSGGYIRGDEIFSIYGIPFDEAVGGDVVYQTKICRKNEEIYPTDIVVCMTDFGETFVMDTSCENSSGEYPIIRIVGEKREFYASEFGEFLKKFSEDNIT